MNNSKFMNIFYSANDLLKHLASFSFAHSFLAYNIIKKLTTLHELHHQKEMFRCFYYFVQLNDVRVTNEFQDMNLPRDSLDICNINNSIFFKDFDGHFLSSWHMGGKLDFAERTFAECFF